MKISKLLELRALLMAPLALLALILMVTNIRTGIALSLLPVVGLAINEHELPRREQTNVEALRSFQHIDQIIYARVRFLILEKLMIMGKASFSVLLQTLAEELTDLTNGNLSGHLAILEDAKYIKGKRAFNGRRPTVVYCITDKGKEAFELFLTALIGRLQLSRIEISTKHK
jgi:DNA-binding HxlR family transcriptional regulator